MLLTFSRVSVVLMASALLAATVVGVSGQSPSVIDDFDDATLDSELWTASDSGGATSETDGRLWQVCDPASGCAGAAVLRSNFTLADDFDVTVDFFDFMGSPGTQAQFGTCPSSSSCPALGIARAISSEEDGYTALGPIASAPAAPSEGALRLNRVGGVLTLHYWTDSDWVELASSPIGTESVGVVLALESLDPSQYAQVGWDNLRLEAGSCDGCPSLPVVTFEELAPLPATATPATVVAPPPPPVPTPAAAPAPTAAPRPLALALASPDTDGDVGLYTSLVLDPSSNPVVSYYDKGNGDIKVLRCGNSTCTSNNSVASPNPGGDVGLYSSLRLDQRGFPVVAYYDQTTRALKLLACGSPNCASSNMLTFVDGDGDPGRFVSLELDSRGFPVMSYVDGSRRLKLVRCADAACAGEKTFAVLDEDADVTHQTSLRFDGQGFPVMAYQGKNTLRVLRCVTRDCSVNNTIATPDSATGVGQYASLALEGGGNPIVSYFDEANGDLKILRCGTGDCGNTGRNTINLPDRAGTVGEFSSLALDRAGNPVVAYYDRTGGDLKLLRCGDPSCAVGNTITVLDSDGDVGQYASLALDPLGSPVISYWDAARGDLKVVRCSSPAC